MFLKGVVMENILAFDIGGTKIAYGLINKDGKFVSEVFIEATPKTLDNILDFFKKTINRYDSQISGVAFSTAGTVNRENDRVTKPVGNLPVGYETIEFSKLSSKPVLVENDANCALWAEFAKGVGQNTNNVVMLTLGTGLGVAAIVDGKMLKGKSGAAGEAHFKVREGNRRKCSCGNYDCLEVYTSGSALSLNAKERYKNDSATSYDVIADMKENKKEAIEAFNDWQDSILDDRKSVV